MADSKITALASISTSTDPAVDPLVIVDVSDTSMAATGTTKKVTLNNLLSSSPTATGALTVTGLVTAGSATITGALAVDTTTLVANAAGYTDKVGIGTATPAQPLHVKLDQNAYTFSRIDNQNVSSGAYAALMLAASGNTWGIGIGSTAANSNALDFFLDAGGANLLKMTLNSTGNLVFPTGKGIDFSAVTGGTGTATANVLNDYEEGTFTATLKGGTTDPTIAVTTTGKYTKIGNQVFVRIMFGNVSTLGASGTISITGLPFTSASAPEQIGYLMVENMATFTNSSLSSYLGASSSTLNLYTSTSNSVITQITHNAGVARYLWTAITYTV